MLDFLLGFFYEWKGYSILVSLYVPHAFFSNWLLYIAPGYYLPHYRPQCITTVKVWGYNLHVHRDRNSIPNLIHIKHYSHVSIICKRIMSPVSMLPCTLLALPRVRLRLLALRNWEKEQVESIVFLRPPKALVGYKNCVYDTDCKKRWSETDQWAHTLTYLIINIV